MNEQALNYSYELFKKDGYTGTLDQYKQLISSDKKALDYSYNLFKNDGYSGSVDDFNGLISPMAVAEEPVKKKEDSISTSSVDGSTNSPEKIPQVLGYSDPFAGSPEPPSFADLFKKKAKKKNVFVPETPLDQAYTSFSESTKFYDENSQKLAEIRSAKMYESMPGDVLGAAGDMLTRQLQDQSFYFGSTPSFTKRDPRPKSSEEILLEDGVINQENLLRQAAESVLAGREEGGVTEEQGLFVKYAPENSMSQIEGLPLVGEAVARKEWNRDVLKTLTTTKDISAAKALDGSNSVEYNIIPDPKKIEDYAFEKYLQATGESLPENLENKTALLEKPSFKLFKNEV